MKRKNMACFFLVLALSFALFVLGCTNSTSSDGELQNKNEYSVLQFYEYEFRNKDNTIAYILHKNALNSGLDVVGFPMAGRNVGYVWFVATTNKDGMVLQIPERTDFLVDEATLMALRKEINFSPAVLNFIESKAIDKFVSRP